jgi:hypothetical protein
MIHLFMGRAVEAGGEKVARGGPRVGRQAQISRHAYKMARGEQERRDQQRAPSHPPPRPRPVGARVKDLFSRGAGPCGRHFDYSGDGRCGRTYAHHLQGKLAGQGGARSSP